jgi:hypothetical protein
MSALTQFFGSSGGGGPAADLPVEVLVVSGGHGATYCKQASGIPGYWPGVGGQTHYTSINVCPGITVPITVGFGGTSYSGMLICQTPSGSQTCCRQYGSAGGGSCFGDCVYVCVRRAYNGVSLDSINYANCPPTCLTPACFDCFCSAYVCSRSSVYELGNKVDGNICDKFDIPGISYNPRQYTPSSRGSNYTSPASIKGYMCVVNNSEIPLKPDPVSPQGYIYSGGTVGCFNDSDYFASRETSCTSCPPCLLFLGAHVAQGFASDITGAMGLYGRGLYGYSSGAWGLSSPCCSNSCDWQVFNGCTGYGRGAIACVCTPTPQSPAVLSQADTGSVVVKYPNDYSAATVSSPNYCDCSPLTPGYRTYRFLCPGSITLP